MVSSFKKPFLGAHESVAGGLHLAFERIERVGGQALQIFTRNQRQWDPAKLKAEEIDLFKAAREKSDNMPMYSHASYLVNLATGKEELLLKSVENLKIPLPLKKYVYSTSMIRKRNWEAELIATTISGTEQLAWKAFGT